MSGNLSTFCDMRKFERVRMGRGMSEFSRGFSAIRESVIRDGALPLQETTVLSDGNAGLWRKGEDS